MNIGTAVSATGTPTLAQKINDVDKGVKKAAIAGAATFGALGAAGSYVGQKFVLSNYSNASDVVEIAKNGVEITRESVNETLKSGKARKLFNKFFDKYNATAEKTVKEMFSKGGKPSLKLTGKSAAIYAAVGLAFAGVTAAVIKKVSSKQQQQLVDAVNKYAPEVAENVKGDKE